MRENLAILFSTETKQFRVFDIEVGKMTRQFSSLSASHAVTSIAASSDAKLLAYTQGNTVVISELQHKKENQIAIRRSANLTALCTKADGSAIAVGDEYGKIYHIMNTNSGKGQDNFVI